MTAFCPLFNDKSSTFMEVFDTFDIHSLNPTSRISEHDLH